MWFSSDIKSRRDVVVLGDDEECFLVSMYAQENKLSETYPMHTHAALSRSRMRPNLATIAEPQLIQRLVYLLPLHDRLHAVCCTTESHVLVLSRPSTNVLFNHRQGFQRF